MRDHSDYATVDATLRPTTGEDAIRVLVADDHAIVRKGICALLATEPGIQVVAEARDAVDQMTWEAGGGGQRYKLTGRLAMLEGDIETAQSLLEQAHAQLGPDRQVANALVQIYLRKNLPGKAEAEARIEALRKKSYRFFDRTPVRED